MFKPRSDRKSGFLPLPATVSKRLPSQMYARIAIPAFLAFIGLYLVVSYILAPLIGFALPESLPQYPLPRPFTSHQIIETLSKYIYPPIEHAPLLKELTVDNLVEEFKVRDSNFPEIEKSLIRLFNFYDDPNPVLQHQKEEAENKLSELSLAKNTFKNQDKIVYRLKNGKSPKIVIVTAIDFEKYSALALTKIVQNRVDYAFKQGYGVYVRWAQEMLPMLNLKLYLRHKERSKWVRIFLLRAAMYAFPDAEWFWYLDEDSLIMELLNDVQQYILNPELLAPIMLRDQLLVPPNGHIKTYKNSPADSVRLILVQSDKKLETHLFFVKNDHVGRAIIESWSNPLYLNYPSFPFGPDSALTHMLQWHPFVLSKTAVIPMRTIAAAHTDVELPPSNGKGGDHIHYYPGDLVAQWTDCDGAQCEKNVDTYFAKLQKST